MGLTWQTVAQFTDREYAADIREYRERFAAVDRSDRSSLRAWFDAHGYLTANDMARIGDVSLRTVGRWKRAAGLPAAARTRPAYRRPPPSPLVAPAGWNDGCWLAEQYPAHSIRAIARAVGRSYTWTRRRLLRLGVRFPTQREAVRSRHPCCTLAWVFDHYVVESLSVTRCARLARVSRSTLISWLLAFRLRVRTNTEQQEANYWMTPGIPYDPARSSRCRQRRRKAGAGG
ncbi:MAG: hypothetical protein K2P78_11970 [Gemmataceae bacterium]|nr:hypothetical protein [Gemmataceae bacterium]